MARYRRLTSNPTIECPFQRGGIRETPSAARTIDLFGRLPDDGPPMLSKRAMSVAPGGDFERNGRWIMSGHYVINYMGNAIVVHCGNQNDDNIIVQFVFHERGPYSAPRTEIEAMLLKSAIRAVCGAMLHANP